MLVKPMNKESFFPFLLLLFSFSPIHADTVGEEIVHDGTDPRDFGRRLQIQNEFYKLKGDVTINTTKIVVNNFLGLKGAFKLL